MRLDHRCLGRKHWVEKNFLFFLLYGEAPLGKGGDRHKLTWQIGDRPSARLRCHLLSELGHTIPLLSGEQHLLLLICADEGKRIRQFTTDSKQLGAFVWRGHPFVLRWKIMIPVLHYEWKGLHDNSFMNNNPYFRHAFWAGPDLLYPTWP